MSRRTDAVEAYFEGFRTTDREVILGLLTDDVTWDLPGYKHVTGKDAFNDEILAEGFSGQPTLRVDRVLEDDDAGVVLVIGDGEAQLEAGGVHRFAYCDVFTFRDDLIARVESYLVPLNPES